MSESNGVVSPVFGGEEAAGVVKPSQYRHPKENFYFLIAAVTGGVVWAILLLLLFIQPVLILTFIIFGGALAIMLLTMKAYFFGNALHVDPLQCPELYGQVAEAAATLGVKKIPYVFVVNGQGTFNAFALRLVGRGYVVLMSSLVDHYMRDKNDKELAFIIAHELAHHAAGHTALWKVLLTGIGSWVPYLGKAYGRACEYTCDRAGALISGKKAAERALLSLAHGSDVLLKAVNLDQFMAQEKNIPLFFGFVLEISSTHPRITRRVKAVRDFEGAA